MKTRDAIAVLLLASVCAAQTPPPGQWERVEKTDVLRGTAYSEFALTGTFLTPPKHASGAPVFVLKCVPGGRSYGLRQYRNGKFLDAYVTVGAVVDHSSGVWVNYRLDDGKIHKETWGTGTDGTAIFPDEIQVNTILYGHFMPHKEGTGSPIHEIVIAVNEFLGAEVVMQFDVPDPTPAAEACGIILHKK
jgi:hypothetical protein